MIPNQLEKLRYDLSHNTNRKNQKEIESIENRKPKITKEYLEKKIMIYRLYKYNLDKQYSCFEKVMHAC